MLVFVLNKHGEPLMPCKPRKARILLKEKKAKIILYEPFTIQLLYGSSGYKQETTIGIDTGAKNIGIAIKSQNKVIAKGEIELRDDIKANLTTRRQYRRSRRNRKTRYRQARFNNRTRPEGWLPPSIQSRINHTFNWIDKFTSLLPNPKLIIEVGKFDVQKMQNPNIQGEEYQQGDTYGYYDARYYVFARDNYTCQVCRSKNKILRTHHIIYSSEGGSDKADNLITVCTDCHTSENHKKGGIFYKWMQKGKKLPSYKETPFMNIIRKKIYKKYPDAQIVYGSYTTPRRKELGLEKTHYNDALAITGIEVGFVNIENTFKIKQFRKKKRSLHEATARKGKKEPNCIQIRNSKNTKYQDGFYLNDKVKVFGRTGFISGFTNGGAYIKDILGSYITIPEKTYKQVSFNHLEFINHNNNWQFIPHLHFV
jgi:5-methylcytosine-specific restriction endonuclease McrA